MTPEDARHHARAKRLAIDTLPYDWARSVTVGLRAECDGYEALAKELEATDGEDPGSSYRGVAR